MSVIDVEYASLTDLDALTPLFDAYRVFYGQPSEPERARRFLHQRLAQLDSVVLLARRRGAAAGFVQLYPSFSSVMTERLWILNDLFVAAAARRQGVGRALLGATRDHGERCGALRLALSTAHDNHAAQALYEAMGWRRDPDRFYVLPLRHGSAHALAQA